MPGQQRHVGAAHAGQGGTQADPVIAPQGGWVVSAQLQPGHPAAGQAGQTIPEQAQRSLVGGRRAEAQPQAARRSGHVVECESVHRDPAHDPGTDPFQDLVQAVAGDGQAVILEADDGTSGVRRLPDQLGHLQRQLLRAARIDDLGRDDAAIQPWTCRMPPTSGCSR